MRGRSKSYYESETASEKEESWDRGEEERGKESGAEGKTQ